jgi:thymidylate synthase
MVNAWNVGELDQMVLPPCHYGFQVYTRELSLEERLKIADGINKEIRQDLYSFAFNNPSYVGIVTHGDDEARYLSLNDLNIPTRAISLMWNQRSVDTFLGLPFNIASYGLLLEIIAKEVNMVPEDLIGNLGDVHLYNNHIEQAKEQLTRSAYDLPKLVINKTDEFWNGFDVSLFNHLDTTDFTIENYQSHPAIKAPLSN